MNMRQILIGCLAATAVLLLSQQKASAWCSFNFSTGVNMSWQSGGCRVLWGLVESAPGPGAGGPAMYCPQQQQQQCFPQQQGAGGQHKRFFRNMFQNNYHQYDPSSGYGGQGCDWGNPQYGFYQYPPYGYYQYPGAEQPAIANK